jgi:two-component system, probable response regulator PhcQ
MSRANVLIVDDDPDAREGLALALHGCGYRLLFADRPSAALAAMRDHPVDVVVSDHLMPEMTGLELLAIVRDRFPDTVRIMLTGHADTTTAVDAINRGEIYRFLEKPCVWTELRVTLHLACEKLELERDHRRLLALVRTSPELVRRLEEERGRRRAPGERG